MGVVCPRVCNCGVACIHYLSLKQGQKLCPPRKCELSKQKQKVAVVGVKFVHIPQLHSIFTANNVQVFNKQAARESFRVSTVYIMLDVRVPKLVATAERSQAASAAP